MIRAILKKGKIQPLEELPLHWRDGQELIVEGGKPSDDPEVIRAWYDELVSLSAQIPAEDHSRMAAALAEQDLHAKERMEFWESCSLDELARRQGVSVPKSLKDMFGGWPDDELDDGFENAVLSWRERELERRE